MKARQRANTLEEFVRLIVVEAQVLALRSRDQRLKDIIDVCATDEVTAQLTDVIRSSAIEEGIENAFTKPPAKQQSRAAEKDSKS